MGLNIYLIIIFAGFEDSVAQLVEHLPFKERVLGSSPSRITNRLGSSVGRASPF